MFLTYLQSVYVECTLGVLDNGGQSPLDKALACDYKDCVDISLFLLSPGYGGDKEKIKLLNGACKWGKLELVKDLIEQQKVDPSECLFMVVAGIYTLLFLTINMHTKMIVSLCSLLQMSEMSTTRIQFMKHVREIGCIF